MKPDDKPESLPASGGPPPPVRSPRRWLRRAVVLVAALGAGYLATVFVLSRFLDPVRLADWMEPRIAAAVNRDVTIGTASVRLLPFELRLGEVEVADPTGLAPTLARVEGLGLRVRLLPLLRRDVRIDRITVEEPRVALQVGPDGRSNFGDLSPTTRPTSQDGDESPFTLELRSLRVNGGVLRYGSATDSASVEVSAAALESSVRRDPDGTWRLAGSAQGDATLSRGPAGPGVDAVPVEVSFDFEADAAFDHLTVRAGTLRMDPVSVEAKGELSGLKESVRRLSLDLTVTDLPVSEALTLLPDSLRRGRALGGAGTLSAELHVAGGLGPEMRPEVTGYALLEGGSLTLSDQPVAEDVSGRVTLRPDRSLEPRLTGTVLGGRAEAEGSLTLGAEGVMDVRIRASPDLARLQALGVLPEGVAVSGGLDADVRVSGPVPQPRRLRFDGSVVARDVRGAHPELGVPVAVREGTLGLEGNRGAFQDVVVALGEDVLTASGEVRDLAAFLDAEGTPFVEAQVRGVHLSLLELRAEPPPDTTLTYGRLAFARLGGFSVGGRSADDAARELGLARPDSLPVAGRLEVLLDTLVDRRGSSQNVHAQVEFGPRYLQVTEASFRRYGGELRSAMNLSLGGDPAQPFTLTLEATEVDAGAFLGATTPLGSLVRGKITLALDVSGSLDGLLLPTGRSLVGAGRYLVSDGGLQATPLTREIASFLGVQELQEPAIRNWGTSFVLEDGIVRLADATVQGAPGEPLVGGGVALDGGLDLLAAFNLPVDRLDAGALERLGLVGDVVTRLRQREDVVQAVLRLGGSVGEPALRADPGSPVRTLTEAAKEEAAQEVQQRIEERKRDLEQRASGFLRGLLQRRDTIAAPPPDTLRADSLAADSIRRDTIPADSVRRDTIPAGPAQPDTVRVSPEPVLSPRSPSSP